VLVDAWSGHVGVAPALLHEGQLHRGSASRLLGSRREESVDVSAEPSLLVLLGGMCARCGCLLRRGAAAPCARGPGGDTHRLRLPPHETERIGRGRELGARYGQEGSLIADVARCLGGWPPLRLLSSFAAGWNPRGRWRPGSVGHTLVVWLSVPRVGRRIRRGFGSVGRVRRRSGMGPLATRAQGHNRAVLRLLSKRGNPCTCAPSVSGGQCSSLTRAPGVRPRDLEQPERQIPSGPEHGDQLAGHGHRRAPRPLFHPAEVARVDVGLPGELPQPEAPAQPRLAQLSCEVGRQLVPGRIVLHGMKCCPCWGRKRAASSTG
jgi:hypothetical protein